MPWEAEVFYAQPGMERAQHRAGLVSGRDRALHADREQPESAHGARRATRTSTARRYPTEGMPEDADSGVLADAGKPMPVHRPRHLQPGEGGHPALEQVSPGLLRQLWAFPPMPSIRPCKSTPRASAILTDAMREQGIALLTSVEPSIFYVGFNMLDPVVGGDSTRARLLRRAISIAVDYRGVHLHLHQRARSGGSESDPAGDLRSSRGRGGDQPLRLRMARRSRRAARSRRGARC